MNESPKENNVRLAMPYLPLSVIDRIGELIKSGFLTEGKIAREFELAVAKYCDVEYTCVVPNATIGLELALRAMIPMFNDRDEVVVPGFTHPATILSIINAGLKAVVVDIDRQTMLIDMNSMQDVIGKNTAAIMPVSLFGNPIDYANLYAAIDLSSKHTIYTIEDAACSIGSKATHEMKPVGSEADVTVFSFHPRKIITTGEGGMILTNNEYILEAVEKMKNFGLDVSGGIVAQRCGSNYRMSDIQASIGLAQMEILDDIIERRRDIAISYDNMIDNDLSETDIQRQIFTKDSYSNFQTYCVDVGFGRNFILDFMRSKGVEAQIASYAVAENPEFWKLKNFNVSSCYMSGIIAKRTMALPLYVGMKEADISAVIQTFKEAINLNQERGY